MDDNAFSGLHFARYFLRGGYFRIAVYSPAKGWGGDGWGGKVCYCAPVAPVARQSLGHHVPAAWPHRSRLLCPMYAGPLWPPVALCGLVPPRPLPSCHRPAISCHRAKSRKQTLEYQSPTLPPAGFVCSGNSITAEKSSLILAQRGAIERHRTPMSDPHLPAP
jgi:hypothetical protein